MASTIGQDETKTNVSRAENLSAAFRRVRAFSETILTPLAPEDCVIQSMPDVSPTRWHLAHTTWFFEAFLLKHCKGYKLFDEAFEYLFNSYYNTLGRQFPRHERGLLSRPTVAEVLEYRRYVDDCVLEAIESDTLSSEQFDVVEVGLNHEQQHQELMLTDIKHVLSCNPIFPCYSDASPGTSAGDMPHGFIRHAETLCEIGHEGEEFAYDNESPRHRTFVSSFELNRRLVTCGEYLEFIEAGGYQHPEYWLSTGWQTASDQGWFAPLYWVQRDGDWMQFTLSGLQPIERESPVCHVSYFEADAYARWANARLPSEAEWERAASDLEIHGNFSDQLIAAQKTVHPIRCGPPSDPSLPAQMFGDVWEWTYSPYMRYPGYRAADDALGEYNGKFMCGQFVLRGGSCATPSGHVRATYRNFFPPAARWQFSGIRLARDVT